MNNNNHFKKIKVVYALAMFFFIILIIFFVEHIINDTKDPSNIVAYESSKGIEKKPTEPEPNFLYFFPEAKYEDNYNNITAKCTKKTYSNIDDRIECTVTNNNPGKAFTIFELPYVEKYNGKSWENVPFNDDVYLSAQWGLCYIEGDFNRKYSTNKCVPIRYFKKSLTAGKYRMVIFVGDTKVYAEFDYQ